MKNLPFLYIFILISSCASLDRKEIKKLDRIQFEPLQINPELEPNSLRIDVIRQSTQNYMGENTWNHTFDPYHQFGFDLGNGIFFDLNYNLSLKLDYLLQFSGDEDFVVNETNPRIPNRGPIIYSFLNDSLIRHSPNKKKGEFLFHKSGNQDSLKFVKNDRQLSAIVKNESDISFYTNQKKDLNVHLISENKFEIEKRRNRETYQMIEGDIFLRNLYSVHLLDNNKKIEIRAIHKNKSRLVSTIVRSQNEIFIYDKQYFGKRIKLEDGVLQYFTNKKPEKEFKLTFNQ